MNNELCTANLSFKLRRSEYEALTRRADGRSLAAYVREKLELPPPPPQGRRWPKDPTERKWKTRA